MSRIAIQLFGHLRSFRLTAESFKKNLLQANSAHQIDVFIHTWNELNYTTRDPLTERDRHFVRQAYAPKAFAEDSPPPKGAESHAATSYNYTMFRAMKLRKAYEQERGVAYDLILITRPDIYFIEPFVVDRFINRLTDYTRYFSSDIGDNALFSTQSQTDIIMPQAGYLCDLLFFGKPWIMDKIASRYETDTPHKIGEAPFLKYLKKQGIDRVVLNYLEPASFVIIRDADRATLQRQYFIKNGKLRRGAFSDLVRKALCCLIPSKKLRRKFRSSRLHHP